MTTKTGIWEDYEIGKGHKYDNGLLHGITALYGDPYSSIGMSFADIGCGDGWYCEQLKHTFNIVHGYEGSLRMKTEGVYKDIFIVDLALKRYTGMRYDLVLCLEVGEHIPKEFEQIFLDNLVQYAGKNLILSWSESRWGRGHFNPRRPKHVIEQMEDRGFIKNDSKTMSLRAFAELEWVKRTVICYERRIL